MVGGNLLKQVKGKREMGWCHFLEWSGKASDQVIFGQMSQPEGQTVYTWRREYSS